VKSTKRNKSYRFGEEVEKHEEVQEEGRKDGESKP
jgi:hypothetical protein